MPTRTSERNENTERPAKRRRAVPSLSAVSLRHPLGIKPSGNAFLADSPSIRPSSLGRLSLLSDDLILHVCTLLDANGLCRLGTASKVLHAFTRSESLWRDLFLHESRGRMKTWAGSWRSTYKLQVHPRRNALSPAAPPVRISNLFSDTLYNPFRAATVPMADMLNLSNRAHVPVARIHASEYTPSRFADEFAFPNLPCIIADDTHDWPCRSWTLDELHRRWPERVFQAEAIRTTLGPYVAYCRSVGAHAARARGVTVPVLPSAALVPDVSEAGMSSFDPYVPADEAPFYLFDSDFAADTHAAPDWRVPSLLRTTSSGSEVEADLFSLLGEKRPDYRWIIAGPERSGSGWHKDPNHTSAWNFVLAGSKAWLMLPPTTPPPGVYVSADEAEVTAPLSLGEWLADYLDETRRRHGPKERGGDGTLVEGVCGVGETMYVPAGWWHLVVNLEESVALTQNFVSTVELPSVLHFMRYKPSQLSGFRSTSGPSSAADLDDNDGDDEVACKSRRQELFDLFCARLGEYSTEVLEKGLRGMETLREEGLGRRRAAATRGTKAAGKKKKLAEDKGQGWWERLKSISSDQVTAGTAAGLLVLPDEDLDEVPW